MLLNNKDNSLYSRCEVHISDRPQHARRRRGAQEDLRAVLRLRTQEPLLLPGDAHPLRAVRHLSAHAAGAGREVWHFQFIVIQY